MRKRDAEAELAELAELDAVGSWLVDHALAIGDLATELSGHLERQGQLSKRRDSREEIDRSIEAKLDQVGSGFDRSRLREMSGWIERDAELQALLEAIERAKGALHVAEGTLAEADRRGASARAAADRAARAAVAEPGGDGRQGDRRGDDEHVELSAGEIAERLGLVSSLRLNLNEKRELEAVAAAELARRDRARDLPRAHGPLVTALLVLVVLALGAGAAVSVHRPLVLLICAVSLVFAAVALGVVVLDVWRPGAGRGGRGPSSLDQGDADSRPVGSPAGRTRRVDEKIADLATRLGLPTQPSQSDVESLDRALRPALDERRALEAALGIAAEETAAILVAREERDARARDLEGALGDLDQWARKLGLAGSLAPATVVATVQALKEARAELRRLDGIERSIAERAPHVEQFDKRLAELLATRPTLAPEHVDSAPEHTEPAPPPLDAEATVRRLDEDLKAARSLSSERAGLGSVASEASAQLASQLRSGEDSESLRVALEKGSPEEWEEADSALVEEGAAASAELEDAVRAHENALAALGELASSDRIAELELRRSGLEADLDRALCSWAELSCARSLISRTLAWHESQRQPAVLARAGEHFSKVTSGRYLRLLPSLEERTQSIRAQLASGGEIDAAKLSRGTVEQLYLCLRLGLAESFAERAVALPLILDDVLVNFDPSRAEATVQALQETAARHQVILLTCHPHIVDLVRAAEPEVQVVELLPG